MARERACKAARRAFHAACAADTWPDSPSLAPPLLAWERWRLAAVYAEDLASNGDDARSRCVFDAVLPSWRDAPSEADIRDAVRRVSVSRKAQSSSESAPEAHVALGLDLVRAGASPAHATAIVAAAVAGARKGHRDVLAFEKRLLSSSAKPEDANRTEKPVVTAVAHRHVVHIDVDGVHLVGLSHAAMDKLSAMHARHGRQGERDDPKATTCRIAALAVRYRAMLGAGFQAAVGGAVFDLLRDRVGVTMECFASPLNARWSRFCSAHEDVDAPFGSAGSFNAFRPLRGSYQANPPFVPRIMDDMAERIVALLKTAAAADEPLAFVVFIPGWQETRCWQTMMDEASPATPFRRLAFVIAADEHGFVDGASHAPRRDTYRASPYDTGVFFLLTDAAQRKFHVTAQLETAVRATMLDCRPTAAAAGRQERKRKTGGMRKKKKKDQKEEDE